MPEKAWWTRRSIGHLLDRIRTDPPEWAGPFLAKWFHVLHPGASWRKRRRGDEVRAAFVDRFFDDSREFERYESEFFDGPIVDVCRSATRSIPEDETIYDAHEDECARLYALIRKHEPEVIVETGVYNGVSTASTLLALQRNEAGTLYSVHCPSEEATGHGSTSDAETEGTTRQGTALGDGGARPADPRGPSARFFRRGRPSCSEPGSEELPPGKDPGWIIPEELHERWKLTLGRSRRVLPELLPAIDAVDLFVHDSEHSRAGMLFEFELAWEWLAPGGTLVSFHVAWNDAFDTFVEERSAEHGLMTYTYSRKTAHDTPCASGYAIRP